MTEKNPIIKAYNEIKPNQDLINRTSVLMKKELQKTEQVHKKRRYVSIRPHIRQIAALACLVVIIIGGMHVYNSNQISPKVDPDVNPKVIEPNQKNNPDSQQPSHKIDPNDNSGNKKPMGKVKVNILGEIEEISEDGQTFRIGDTWYMVDDSTEYDESNEDHVDRTLRIGDYISAYTSNELIGEYIIVDYIYSHNKK